MEDSKRSISVLRVDSDNKDNITALQLQSAFAIGNLQFRLTVVQQMIRMYDFDRNGTMKFQEFVELNKFLVKVQHAFADLDRGLGYLVPRGWVKLESRLTLLHSILCVRVLMKRKVENSDLMTL